MYQTIRNIFFDLEYCVCSKKCTVSCQTENIINKYQKPCLNKFAYPESSNMSIFNSLYGSCTMIVVCLLNFNSNLFSELIHIFFFFFRCQHEVWFGFKSRVDLSPSIKPVGASESGNKRAITFSYFFNGLKFMLVLVFTHNRRN